MGPESTAELLAMIVRSTPVTREQDHLRVIVDSNPKVPDRTEALLSGETAAVARALSRTARNLERAGAEVIGMPCNTAHAFIEDIRASVDVPVLDMIEEAARRALREFGSGTVIGVLATNGTHKAGLFEAALTAHGLVPVVPASREVQQGVMDALQGVKLRGVTEEARQALAIAVADLVEQGTAVGLIAGCTEVSLVFNCFPPDLPWLDPLQVLAEAMVREGLNGVSGGGP
jgi:aspartate racemase